MILSRCLLVVVIFGLLCHHGNSKKVAKKRNSEFETLGKELHEKSKNKEGSGKMKRKLQRKLKSTEKQLTEYKSRLEVLEQKFAALEKRVIDNEAEVVCPTLTPLLNGKVAGNCSNVVGSACTFLCDDGYHILGEQQITCVRESENNVEASWNHQKPTCEPVVCPSITAPENGGVSCSSRDYAWSSNCTFHCGDGFRLTGNTMLICSNGGGNGTSTGYWVSDGNDNADGQPAETPTCVEYTPPQALKANETITVDFPSPSPIPSVPLVEDPLQDVQPQGGVPGPQNNCDTMFGFFKDGYRYDLWPRRALTWSEAQENCVRSGGELAYHGLDNLETRMEIVKALTINERPYPGLRSGVSFWLGLFYTDDDTWAYLDGSVAPSGDVHWKPDSPSFEGSMYHYKDASYKCAAWSSNEGYTHDLLTFNTFCIDNFYGLCEYKCEM